MKLTNKESDLNTKRILKGIKRYKKGFKVTFIQNIFAYYIKMVAHSYLDAMMFFNIIDII